VIHGVSRIADMAEGLFTEITVGSMTGADAAQRITGFFDGRKANGRSSQ